MSVQVIKSKLEELSVSFGTAITNYTTEQEFQDWARVFSKDVRVACLLIEP